MIADREPFVWHTALDAPGTSFGTGGRVPEVTVRGALGLGHGSQRTHPTVGLVGAAGTVRFRPALPRYRRTSNPSSPCWHQRRWPWTGHRRSGCRRRRSSARRCLPARRKRWRWRRSAARRRQRRCGWCRSSPTDADLDRVGASLDQSSAASAVAMLPPITCTCGKFSFTQRTRSITPRNGHGRYPPPPRRRRPQPAPRRGHRCRRRYRLPRRRAGGPGCPWMPAGRSWPLDITEGHRRAGESWRRPPASFDAVLVEFGLDFFRAGAFEHGDQLFLGVMIAATESPAFGVKRRSRPVTMPTSSLPDTTGKPEKPSSWACAAAR